VIRPTRPTDAAALAAVAAVTFPLACPPHTTEEAKAHFVATVLSEERFDEYIADAGRRLLVAEQTDENTTQSHLVGYTMMNLTQPTDRDVAAALTLHPAVELSKCYVMPDAHGTGVASALMAASLEAARETGAAAVWLGVNEENAKAQRFYAKHGFERVGTKHFQVGDRLEDDFVLERPL
jgi:ribosomal protein S18 acetylase RimI-like enzyme